MAIAFVSLIFRSQQPLFHADSGLPMICRRLFMYLLVTLLLMFFLRLWFDTVVEHPFRTLGIDQGQYRCVTEVLVCSYS